jgi:hypothetical protein
MSQCQNCKAMVNQKWAVCLSCGAAIQADGGRDKPGIGPMEYPVKAKMDSSILGADVPVELWPDRAMVDGVEYSKQELADLLSRGLPAADLEMIHETKRSFDGEI